MPWEKVWREPELVLEYQGVSVFKSYKAEDWEEPLFYWFDVYEENEPAGNAPIDLDVRCLPGPGDCTTLEGQQERLKRGIEAGLIRPGMVPAYLRG